VTTNKREVGPVVSPVPGCDYPQGRSLVQITGRTVEVGVSWSDVVRAGSFGRNKIAGGRTGQFQGRGYDMQGSDSLLPPLFAEIAQDSELGHSAESDYARQLLEWQHQAIGSVQRITELALDCDDPMALHDELTSFIETLEQQADAANGLFCRLF
jgi:hypothetical protein